MSPPDLTWCPHLASPGVPTWPHLVSPPGLNWCPHLASTGVHLASTDVPTWPQLVSTWLQLVSHLASPGVHLASTGVQAKEMRRRSSKRRETDVEYEEKKASLSLTQVTGLDITGSPAHLATCSPAHLLTCSPAHLATCSPVPR